MKNIIIRFDNEDTAKASYMEIFLLWTLAGSTEQLQLELSP